jgi:acyl carrier protein
MDLDCFVLFSSISSVWGSREIAHYAAANAFLDGFAEYRKALNLPILAINWGPWAEGGMTTTDEQSQMARLGIQAMSPESSLKILHDALASQKSSLVVASVNWQRLKTLYESIGYGSLFSEIPLQTDAAKSDTAVPGPASNANQGIWLSKLQALNQKEKTNHLFDLIKTEIATIMRCEASEINTDAGFIDLGLDSLMAVELKDILEQQLNLTLDATVIFDYPNLKALVDFLLILLVKGEGRPVDTTTESESLLGAQPKGKTAPQIGELSDDDIAKLIEKEIEDI